MVQRRVLKIDADNACYVQTHIAGVIFIGRFYDDNEGEKV